MLTMGEKYTVLTTAWICGYHRGTAPLNISAAAPHLWKKIAIKNCATEPYFSNHSRPWHFYYCKCTSIPVSCILSLESCLLCIMSQARTLKNASSEGKRGTATLYMLGLRFTGSHGTHSPPHYWRWGKQEPVALYHTFRGRGELAHRTSIHSIL